jgi:hypothetical protein
VPQSKKAAYLGPFRQYMNPYTELTMECLTGVFAIDYFGPGFRRSLKDFVKKSDDYEFVIFDSQTAESEKFLNSDRPFGGSYSHVTKVELNAYLREIQSVLASVGAEKIFIANLDTYATEQALVDRLVDLKALTLTMSDKNTTLGYATYKKERELTDTTMLGHTHPTDVWRNYVSNCQERIISVPHFIGLAEFDFQDNGTRRSTIDIPGIGYEDRQKFVHMLNRGDRLRFTEEFVKYKSLLFLNRINRRFTQTQLTKFRSRFLTRLSNSLAHITTGGPMKFPVRKFYEIPARNALLVCESFYGAQHHGFEKGIHFLPATEGTIQLLYDKSEKDDRAFGGMRDAAFSLVMEKHSLPARLRQIRPSFDLISSGSFHGSIWQDGRYLNL